MLSDKGSVEDNIPQGMELFGRVREMGPDLVQWRTKPFFLMVG